MKNDHYKIVDKNTDPALILDEEGKILFFNKAASKLWGKQLTDKTFITNLLENSKFIMQARISRSEKFHLRTDEKYGTYHIFPLVSNSSNNKKIFYLSSRLNQNHERYNQYLKTIHKISSRSYNFKRVSSLARFVVNQLFNEEYNFYHVGLFLKDKVPEGKWVSLVAVAGESKAMFHKYCDNAYKQSAETGVIGRVLQHGTTEIINDTEKIDYYHSTPYFKGKSEICAPIIINKEVIGVINIESKNLTCFDDADALFLAAIADIFAANLSRIKTTKEISQKNLKLQNYLLDLKGTKEILELQSNNLKKSLIQGDEARQVIKKQNELMQNKLRMGAELQKSLLPKGFPNLPQLYFSSKYQPNYHLGGDFYDVSMVDDKNLAVMIADVSGYGVSAAMIAAMFKAYFNNYRRYSESPALILENLNKEFCSIITTGEYITAFLAIINTETFKITYANAGHPCPFLYKGDSNSVEELDSDGFFLGIFKDQNYKDKKSSLSPGDKLFLYTDGALEVKGSKQVLLGKERLRNKFKQVIKNNKTTKNRLHSIYSYLKSFSVKSTFDDDVTLLLLERSLPKP
ncbi:MAG: SpoIIE family protein phosphatase [bacterium]|nr:MAG: SpoIIE family protein phosphatase [bacterium]